MFAICKIMATIFLGEPFQIYTDQKSLNSLMTNNSNTRAMKMEIQNCKDFSLKYFIDLENKCCYRRSFLKTFKTLHNDRSSQGLSSSLTSATPPSLEWQLHASLPLTHPSNPVNFYPIPPTFLPTQVNPLSNVPYHLNHAIRTLTNDHIVSVISHISLIPPVPSTLPMQPLVLFKLLGQCTRSPQLINPTSFPTLVHHTTNTSLSTHGYSFSFSNHFNFEGNYWSGGYCYATYGQWA